MARTLFEKVWDAHVAYPGTEDSPAILYTDLHLVHEVTSPQAFALLRERGLRVRRTDRTLATMDHSTPTTPHASTLTVLSDANGAAQLAALEQNCRDFGVTLYALGHERQGIVHVIGPELGLTQPGMTIVCGDSHTSTHGAFGALAFGIGTSEVAHVLATQCLFQKKPKTLEVRVDGRLAPGVTAKDVILALIAQIGVRGGTGHVIEYAGQAIRALSMEERMTVCNMSIEGGARAGMIAPDDATFEYIADRPFAPRGADWDTAVARWRALVTDDGSMFDARVDIDASALEPMITFGTNPGMAIPINGRVPVPSEAADAASRNALDRALRYMELEPGEPLLGRAIDVVFLGSCTNSRLLDLRAAATMLRGRRIAPGVRMLVVPGSRQVKAQAEAEGLDEVFRAAGAEWREAGCSMCIAMNGDELRPGQYAVSTSNRNFEGRQGRGGRTFLASPLTAAATAVNGVITDPRSVPTTPVRIDVAPAPDTRQDRAPTQFSREGAKLAKETQRSLGRPLGAMGGSASEFQASATGSAGNAATPKRSDAEPGTRNPEPETRFSSTALALPLDDVDTDRIIPARFLKVTGRDGLADALFADERTDQNGAPRADFPLNRPEADTSSILVGGRNFGCGSSREHAVWALRAFGFRAVVAPSFADIFRANALGNGLVPITVDAATHAHVLEHVRTTPAAQFTVDMVTRRFILPDGSAVEFEIDPLARRCLIEGTDALGLLLAHEAEIARYESSRSEVVECAR